MYRQPPGLFLATWLWKLILHWNRNGATSFKLQNSIPLWEAELISVSVLSLQLTPILLPCRPVTSPRGPFPDCPSEPLNSVWSRRPSQILLWEGSSGTKRGHYKCESHKQQNCVAFVSCNTLFFIPFSRNLKLYSSKQLKLIQMLQVTMAIWVRKYFSLDSIEIL